MTDTNFYNKSVVSVIMPVFNGEATIVDAIESVIAQTFKEWELLIIDDGSTDTTAKIVYDYERLDQRIKYLKNESNYGIQKTLNNGLKVANGKYIARIDADDIWSVHNKLERQVQFLESNNNHVIVGCNASTIDENRNRITTYSLALSDIDIRKRILGKNCFVHSAVMFMRESAVSVGGYSEAVSRRHVEDHDLWLKLGLKGKLANINESMVTLLVSPQSLTAKNRISQAVRMLRLGWLYKNKYPNYCGSLFVSIGRLCFFAFISIIPIKRSILYKIQGWYRSL